MTDIIGRDEAGEYRVEVIADSSGKWCGNGVRLDTAENAEAYARDLSSRWISVRRWRVMRSYVDDALGPVDVEVDTVHRGA